MFYLILSIIGGALLSILLRLSKGRIRSSLAMLLANYLTCTILASALIGWGNVLPEVEGRSYALAAGAFNGLLYLSSFALMEYSTREYGVVLPAVFSKLGLLVPVLLSFLLFNEVPTVFQIAGFVVALFSIVLINYEKGQKLSLNLWLLLLLIGDGSASAMLKIFGETGNSALSQHFILYTFFFAGLVCLGAVLYRREKMGLTELGFGILIGFPNFFASRFMMRSLESLPGVIAYPTRAVAIILLVALAGAFFFRERLNRNQWLAVAAIMAALVLLNI